MKTVLTFTNENNQNKELWPSNDVLKDISEGVELNGIDAYVFERTKFSISA